MIDADCQFDDNTVVFVSLKICFLLFLDKMHVYTARFCRAVWYNEGVFI
jgi:hypothetical protein